MKRVFIVNVVAYGYHSIGGEASLTEQDAVSAYLEQNRDRETAAANELTGFLTKSTFPVKMLTLVTKQDLWCQEEASVKAHYEQGAYADIVQQITTAKGEQNFIHEFAYVSLFSQNILTNGIAIGLTAPGYDDGRRLDSQKRAFEMIEMFLK